MNHTIDRESLTIFPAIDLVKGTAVRLLQGEAGTETNYGDPIEIAHQWREQGAQWIHLVDLDAAFGRGNNREVIGRILKEVSGIQIEVSGGIRDDASLENVFDLGAARVNIGTAAIENLEWTRSIISRYGQQIAVGIDVREETVATRGWTKDGGCVWELLDKLQECGCARYVVTDVMRDGTLQGPNLALLQKVAEYTQKPVIASGGISQLQDISKLKNLVPSGIEGVIIGKALYAKQFTLSAALEIANA